MTRFFLSLGALTVVTAVAQAQALPRPMTPAPQFYQVSGVNQPRGEVVLTRLTSVAVHQQVAVQEILNGQRVTISRVQVRHVLQAETRNVAVTDGSVVTAGNEKLTQAEALKRLADGTIVLLGGDGQNVDPAYFRALRPETLILSSPAAPAVPAAPALQPAPLLPAPPQFPPPPAR